MSESVTCEKTCPSCDRIFTAKMNKLLGAFPVPVRVFKIASERCLPCTEAARTKDSADSLRRRLNFSREQVRSHFIENSPHKGDTLILCMQQYHRSTYRLVIVENPDYGRQHRIIIDKGCSFAGASFYRTGQSTFAPKSQTSLLPLVPTVAERLCYERDTELTAEDLYSLLGT